MPHDLTHTCERCHRLRDLFYVKSVDEYLCDECIMILAQTPIAPEADDD